MRGMRKLPTKKKPGRRFPDREDAAHLERIRNLPCLLRGKRCEILVWRGVHPNKVQEAAEFAHICAGRVEAHHVVTKARGGHDHDSVPLCLTAHASLHSLGQPAFEERWNLDLGAEASRLSPNTDQ